jgi:ATP-dependent DNA helicase RecQ
MKDPLTALKQALRQNMPDADSESLTLPAYPNFEYAVTRFLSSWSRAGKFGADQAILLRQALRYMDTSVAVNGVPPEDPEVLQYLKSAGIEWTHSGTIHATPFTPPWMDNFPLCDANPTERNLEERFAGEAYLQSVGYPSWRSPAQKEAAWFTLCSPPGSTRIVVLPTGSGKSLCFQLLPRFAEGLTVVVVPTIALAIDQQINSARLFKDYRDVNPVSYAADDGAETTLSLVETRRTRLLFTSPEACVSGRLRGILDKFAGEGWFANLVVDEAHLIEGWGTHFRVEFQFLSSAKRVWLERSGGKLRTFLFSATMTERCRGMLGELFSKGTGASEFVCQRLRSEISYFAKTFGTKSDRDRATIEALWKLPRPAILYVTEKKEAENFVTTLQSQGMVRIATFHGDTKPVERREILRRWKNHEIDLIIATSAFGVGVDKADVRAVVHACYPENLDRYYQEVGRGGRDGWSSVSLLLTCPRDRITAERITVKLMRPEMIQKRWEAMIRNAERLDHLLYALPVGVRWTGLLGTRTYKENVRWNKRLVLQLQRAKRLDLVDLARRPPSSPEDDPEEWVTVKLAFPPDTAALSELIKDQRNEEATYFYEGLDKLSALLSSETCSARCIAKLYGIDRGQRECPGCPRCRMIGCAPLDCEPLAFPEVRPACSEEASLWVENAPSYAGHTHRMLFVDALSRCVTDKGLRQFYCPQDHYEIVLGCFAEALPQNTRELHRLDPLHPGTKVSPAATLPLVFLHFGKVDPKAVTLGRSYPCIHLFCGHHGNDGRDVAVTENLRRWTFEAWLSTTPENSLPCLPTTQ